jgi:hypothetical protein
MSPIGGGICSAGWCLLGTFPQVRAFSNVSHCYGELAGLGLFVPTLCPHGITPSRYLKVQPLRRVRTGRGSPSQRLSAWRIP